MSALSRSLLVLVFLGITAFGVGRADALDTTYFAILNGGNEVSGTGQANAGDPNGLGAASILFVSRQRLCFSILVRGIGQPNAAHIHRGRAGINGPIVVTLTPPATGDPGNASGCVNVPIRTALQILLNPAGHYVNVHTGRFPDGAVRGQLF